MHEQFVEPTKRDADVIIPEGANRMAIDLLTEKVQAEAGLDRDPDAEFGFEPESSVLEPDGDPR